jgi:hypothetical protein
LRELPIDYVPPFKRRRVEKKKKKKGELATVNPYTIHWMPDITQLWMNLN